MPFTLFGLDFDADAKRLVSKIKLLSSEVHLYFSSDAQPRYIKLGPVSLFGRNLSIFALFRQSLNCSRARISPARKFSLFALPVALRKEPSYARTIVEFFAAPFFTFAKCFFPGDTDSLLAEETPARFFHPHSAGTEHLY